jgi:hypothetical protein
LAAYGRQQLLQNLSDPIIEAKSLVRGFNAIVVCIIVGSMFQQWRYGDQLD